MPFYESQTSQDLFRTLLGLGGAAGKFLGERGIFGTGVNPELSQKERERGLLDQYASTGSSYGIPEEQKQNFTLGVIAYDPANPNSQPISFPSELAVPKGFRIVKPAGEDFDSWLKTWGPNLGTFATPGTPGKTEMDYTINGVKIDPNDPLVQEYLKRQAWLNKVPATIPRFPSKADGGIIQPPQDPNMSMQGFNPIQYLKPMNDPLSILKNLLQAERGYAGGGQVMQASQASQAPMRQDDQLAAVQTGEFIIPVDLSAALLKKFGGEENLMKTLAQLAAAQGMKDGGKVDWLKGPKDSKTKEPPAPETDAQKAQEYDNLTKEVWLKNPPIEKEYNRLAQYMRADADFRDKYTRLHPTIVLDLSRKGMLDSAPKMGTDAWKKQNIEGWTPEAEAAGQVKSMHTGVPFVEAPVKENGGASVSWEENKTPVVEVKKTPPVVPAQVVATPRAIPGTPGTDATSRSLPTVRRFAQNAQGQTILNPDFKDIPTQYAEQAQRTANAKLTESEAALGPEKLALAKQQLDALKAETAVRWAQAMNGGMSQKDMLELIKLQGDIKNNEYAIKTRAVQTLKDAVTSAEATAKNSSTPEDKRAALEARMAYMVAMTPELALMAPGSDMLKTLRQAAARVFGNWDINEALKDAKLNDYNSLFAKAVLTAANLGAVAQPGVASEAKLDATKTAK
jgi:hypothetical protein